MKKQKSGIKKLKNNLYISKILFKLLPCLNKR